MEMTALALSMERFVRIWEYLFAIAAPLKGIRPICQTPVRPRESDNAAIETLGRCHFDLMKAAQVAIKRRLEIYP
jgi:hypothetical protein